MHDCLIAFQMCTPICGLNAVFSRPLLSNGQAIRMFVVRLSSVCPSDCLWRMYCG